MSAGRAPRVGRTGPFFGLTAAFVGQGRSLPPSSRRAYGSEVSFSSAARVSRS